MNRLLKDLADKARKAPLGDSWAYVHAEEFEKRFAELIVRECVDIADEYDGVGSTIVSRIKKHFGVE